MYLLVKSITQLIKEKKAAVALLALAGARLIKYNDNTKRQEKIQNITGTWGVSYHSLAKETYNNNFKFDYYFGKQKWEIKQDNDYILLSALQTTG